MYIHVHRSINHSSQKVETTQALADGRMDEQVVGYTHDGIWFNYKEEGSPDTFRDIGEPQKIMRGEISHMQVAYHTILFMRSMQHK